MIRHDNNLTGPTPNEAVETIRARFVELGYIQNIPKFRGGTFRAKMVPGGVEVDNLHVKPFLPWDVFEETVRLLIHKGGRARKGNAMGPRLGEPALPLDSIEGHVAHVVYGKHLGDSLFRRITPIACILVWADVCENGRGELVLRSTERQYQKRGENYHD